MNIKSNIQLLAEAAATDLQINTQAAVELDSIKESYNSIPTAEGYCVTEAADVVVNKIGNDYYVEMVNLSPFMLDSGITTIAKALNLVAEANGLPAKSVGLVIDSQESVNNMLASSDARAKSTGNTKIRENAVAKIQKNIAIANKLISEGYKVTKKGDKKDKNSVCPECGKAKCKCKCEDDKKKSAKDECGGSCGKGPKKECDAPGSTAGKAVISEKKECGAGCKKTNESVNFFDNFDAFVESAINEYQGELMTEADTIQFIQEFGIKTKADVDERLRVLDSKKPSAESISQQFVNDAKQTGSALLAGIPGGAAAFGAGVAVEKLTKSAVAGSITMNVAAVAIGALAGYAVACMTRIFNSPGSISDNINYAKRIQKQFEKSIEKFEKKGDEKMVKRCKEAKAKVDARLAELEKKAKGKNLYYQNTHNEKGERFNGMTGKYDKDSTSKSKSESAIADLF